MALNKKRNNLAIRRVLSAMGIEPQTVAFCAEGEYNANYRVQAENALIFRINKDSQRNDPKQIIYEYKVLSLLAESTYTPKPISIFYPHAQVKHNPFKNTDDYAYAAKHFPRGFLLMEYVDGIPFSYKNYCDAAKALAHIHKFSSQYDDDIALDIQTNPTAALLTEGERYLEQEGHPKQAARKYLQDYIFHARTQETSYPNTPFCIVNTELNSGNIIQGEQIFIVDWEKAVYSYPYQDLAHFLVPTTTLWKTDFRFSRKQEEDFYKHYLSIHPICTLDELSTLVEQFKHAVLARALGWCYMAWYQNMNKDDTSESFDIMEYYLDNIPLFLT